MMEQTARHFPDQFLFFLGGNDLEMVTIRDLLDEAGVRYHDKKLGWGAKASSYQDEIEKCLSKGITPVFVELEDDLGLAPERAILIHHHGERAGGKRPTALHQVFELLGLQKARWTRQFELVASNDRGHVPALVRAGATREEIIGIRRADREAQGITEEEELQGEAAADSAETYEQGILTVVRLPHAKAAVITDRLQAPSEGVSKQKAEPMQRPLSSLTVCSLNWAGQATQISWCFHQMR